MNSLEMFTMLYFLSTITIDPSDPLTVPKYVDKLPIPSKLKPNYSSFGIPYYEVEMGQFKQRLHKFFPETKVWGFNKSYPGPIIEAEKNRPVKIKWVNNLPKKHLFPVDKTIHGAMGNPEVRTVVHLHGGHTSSDSDGYPEAWYTKKYKVTGPYFKSSWYYYSNNQPSAPLFYHDHAIGITRLNVYAGLIGLYYIRDKNEHLLGLPKDSYEIPLLIQDKTFNKDGSLYYPSQPDPPVPDVNPSVVPEFFGNTILVNGKVWPYLMVQPRKYRFRIYNGSNSRFYRLKLSLNQSFTVIGNDSGLLEKPVKTDSIILAPAERVDVILDFADYNNQNIIMTNDAPTPYPAGTPADPLTTGQIMLFVVRGRPLVYNKSMIKNKLDKYEYINVNNVKKIRDQVLVETTDQYGRLLQLLNNKQWDDPMTDKPKLNTAEIWRFINTTGDTHPMHLHLVRFRILDRQPFDVNEYISTGKLIITGPPVKPELYEVG